MSERNPADEGREVDERAARLVWPDAERAGTLWWGRRPDTPWSGPAFSTDRQDAMSLLDTLAERGWDWAISTASFSPVDKRYYAGLWRGADPQEYHAAPMLPLAIVRAVLAALGEGPE